VLGVDRVERSCCVCSHGFHLGSQTMVPRASTAGTSTMHGRDAPAGPARPPSVSPAESVDNAAMAAQHVGRPRTTRSGASQARAGRFAKRRGGRRGTASASSGGHRPMRRLTASFWPVAFGGVPGARAGSPVRGD
jgi:hypothetical protein